MIQSVNVTPMVVGGKQRVDTGSMRKANIP